MADTPSYEQKTEMQYDRFIKKVLVNERSNFITSLKRRMSWQTLFCELGDGKENSFEDDSALDALARVEAEFQVMRCSVPVRNAALYETLSKIDERARNVILMSYWFGMTDQEIADETGLKRRTVNDVKNKTYKKLRTMLEEDGYDASSFFPRHEL